MKAYADALQRIRSRSRTWLVTGTAESKRRYDLGTGGRAVRVRSTDPLAAISSLTPVQRRAGQAFRDDFEARLKPGVKLPVLNAVHSLRPAMGIPETENHSGH